jgi:hypothetical protein
VLPAFEYVRQAEGRNQDTFPRDRHVRSQFSFLCSASVASS